MVAYTAARTHTWLHCIRASPIDLILIPGPLSKRLLWTSRNSTRLTPTMEQRLLCEQISRGNCFTNRRGRRHHGWGLMCSLPHHSSCRSNQVRAWWGAQERPKLRETRNRLSSQGSLRSHAYLVQTHLVSPNRKFKCRCYRMWWPPYLSNVTVDWVAAAISISRLSSRTYSCWKSHMIHPSHG